MINWITTHSRIINIFLVLSFRPLRFFSLTLSLFAATFAIQLQKWNFGYGRCRRLSMLSPLILVLLCRCSLTYCTQHSHCGLRRVFFLLFFLPIKHLVLLVVIPSGLCSDENKIITITNSILLRSSYGGEHAMLQFSLVHNWLLKPIPTRSICTVLFITEWHV